jgi:hypothetical protein
LNLRIGFLKAEISPFVQGYYILKPGLDAFIGGPYMPFKGPQKTSAFRSPLLFKSLV